MTGAGGAGSDGQADSGTRPHSPDADEILEMPGTLGQAVPPTEEPKQ
jgi:hypothetical protein